MLITDVSSLQECVPEFLDIKQSVHNKLDVLVNDDVILSSSASSLVPSMISEKLRHRNRFIVVHPVSPYCLYYKTVVTCELMLK